MADNVLEILPNGKIVQKTDCIVYIPNNFDNETTATIFYPGADTGYTESSKYIKDSIIANNPNQIIIIDSVPPSYNQEKMDASIDSYIYIANQIASENGIKLDGVNTAGSSVGARDALKTFAYQAMDEKNPEVCVILGAGTIDYKSTWSQYNPDVKKPTALYGDNNPNWPFLNNNEYEAIKGKTVILFENKYGTDYDYVKELAKHGVNTVVVECDRGSHDDLTKKNIQKDVLDLIGGDIDKFDAEGCTFKIFDSETNTWKEITKEEVPLYSNNTMKPFYTTNGTFNGIPASGTIASNLYDVYRGMDEINSTIQNTSSIFKLENQSYAEGTSSIPKDLSTSVNALYSISQNLLTSLSGDAQSICNIAKYLYDMDADLCANTSTVSTEIADLYSKAMPTVENELSKITVDLNKIDTSVFATKFTEGNAGRASSSEIIAETSKLVASLDLEIDDASKTATAIRNFASTIGTGNIVGEMWNKVADTLNNYSHLMDLRKDSAVMLQEALKIAAALIIDYIGDDGELDDSKIPELEQEITNCKSQIDSLTQKINAEHEVCETIYDEYKNITYSNCHLEYLYSASKRSAWQKEINEYNDKIDELNKEIEKLKGLAEIINQAQEIINAAIESIKDGYGQITGEVASTKLNNFNYSLNGIDFKSIAGDTFDKDKYLAIYDKANEKYHNEQKTVDTTEIDERNKETGIDSKVGGNPYTNNASNNSEKEPVNKPETDNESEQENESEIETDNEPEKEPEQEVKPEPIIEPNPETKPNSEINSLLDEERKKIDEERKKIEEERLKLQKEKNKSNKWPININTRIKEIQKETERDKDNIIIPTEDEPIDVVIEDIPIEPIIEIPDDVTVEPIIEQLDTPIVDNPTVKKENNVGKTIGIAAGISLVVGAAAYGAHEYQKSKENDDESYE